MIKFLRGLILHPHPCWLLFVLLFSVTNTFATSSINTLIQTAKKTQDPPTQYKLGILFQKGSGVKKNPEKAKIWYYRAAKQGNALAQTSLGKMQLYGRGIPKNLKRAYFWLSKAAKQGHSEAQYELGNILRYGIHVRLQASQGRRWYQKAAVQGYADAQYALALLYEAGVGAQIKPHRAKHWFQQAAQQGHHQAKQKLSHQKKSISATPTKHPSKRVNKSSNKPQPSSQKRLTAANAGDEYAQYNLGIAYLRGQGIDKDPRAAFIWLQKSARQNHPQAQYILGTLYVDGIGIERNMTIGSQWLQKAANQDVMAAKTALHYMQAANVEQWYKAESGDSETQYQLANKFFTTGREKDIKIAIKWLTMAAVNDHMEASHQLGELYRDGSHIQLNQTKAFKWFKRAASLGKTESQHQIGLMYQHGIGTLSDQTLAQQWLKRAAQSK